MFISDLGCFCSSSDLTFCKLSCFFINCKSNLYKKCTISRSFLIVSISFLFLPSFALPFVILSIFSQAFLTTLYLQSFSFYTYRSSSATFPHCAELALQKERPLLNKQLLLSTTEEQQQSKRPHLNQKPIMQVWQGFFNGKFEDMLKIARFASYCVCNFQLTTLCCI